MPVETNKTAGDDIESRCLKCKSVTTHTIIAMTGNTIVKVQCSCCDGKHNYRPVTAEKKRPAPTILRRRNGDTVTVSGAKTSRRKTTRTTTKKAANAKDTVSFETLLQGRKVANAAPYAVNATLTVNDLLRHSIFGLGVVTSTILPNKAEIMFQDIGSKILICIPA